ncbi:MAG: hypothetical protein ABJB47_06220 [Actinomycetota bacterium]
MIWFPTRSAAEHLDPASFHAVIIHADVLNPKPHTVRRVVSSPKAIRQLTSLLDGLPAAPDVSQSCPALTISYRFTFVRSGARKPAAMITDNGCDTAGMTVDGKVQPAPWDRSGKLTAAAHRLLPIMPPA